MKKLVLMFIPALICGVVFTSFVSSEVSSTATSEGKKVVVMYATPDETETTLTVDGVLYKLKISPKTKGGLQFNWEWLPTASTEAKKFVIVCSAPSKAEAMLTSDGVRYTIKISPTTTTEGKAQFKWEWMPLD